jgi:hypothetical protein
VQKTPANEYLESLLHSCIAIPSLQNCVQNLVPSEALEKLIPIDLDGSGE